MGFYYIVPLGRNFSEISNQNTKFSLTKMHLKISSAKLEAILSGGGGGGGGGGVTSLNKFWWKKYVLHDYH